MTRSHTTSARFVPVRTLASGGMGSVELVLRNGDRFTRPFVLKRPIGVSDASGEQLMDEARIGGMLDDPRVVSVLDVGTDERGMYLVMEYVNGATLAELLVRLFETGTTLSVDCAVYIVEQLALGLHSAHELTDGSGRLLGIVHRDVSPQNVLLDFNGRVRLTDFGIALAAGRSHQTGTGLVRGKAGYLAPEQLGFGEIDRRADLFALGVVLFESLTRQRLFGGSRNQKVVEFDLTDFRDDVPVELEELLYQLLSESPENRPASGEEIALRLGALLGDRRRAEKELAQLVSAEFGQRRESLERELSEALRAEPVESEEGERMMPPAGRRAIAVAFSVLVVASLVLAFVTYRLARPGEAKRVVADGRESVARPTLPPAEMPASKPPVLPEEEPAEQEAKPDDEPVVEETVVREAAKTEKPSRTRKRRRAQRGRKRPARERQPPGDTESKKPTMWDWKD